MLMIAALGTGCAATRSEVKLASPVAAPAASVPGTGKVVVIRSVTDARMIVTDGAWIELVDKALQDYRAQVASKAGAWR